MNSNEQTTKKCNLTLWNQFHHTSVSLVLPLHNAHLDLLTAIDPFHLWFFNHNSVCLHPNSNEVIATKFCTCHDSIAVLACAKICSNMMTRYWIIAKQKDSAESVLWLDVLLVRCAWGSTKTSFSPAENLKRQVLSLRNWYSLTEGIHLSGDQKWHLHLSGDQKWHRHLIHSLWQLLYGTVDLGHHWFKLMLDWCLIQLDAEQNMLPLTLYSYIQFK